jgi:hypothetical protein
MVAGRTEWLGLVDGFMLLIRTRLPQEWARFCEIAEELKGIGPRELAGQNLLQWPVSAADKIVPGWIVPGGPRDTRQYRSLILAIEVRREKLIRETLVLRRRFNAVFADAMRSGDWDVCGFSPDDGSIARSMECSAWWAAELELDLINDTVRRAGKEWLVGVQVRSRRRTPAASNEGSASVGPDVEPEADAGAAEPSKPAGPPRPRRGAPSGTTNLIEQQRRALVPKLREGRVAGEPLRRAITRLCAEKKIPLPLPGNGTPDNNVDTLARIWAREDKTSS